MAEPEEINSTDDPKIDKPDEGRRSLPRLREILRRQRRDSDPGQDAPVLNFQYNDTDSLLEELAELYSYTEQN